MTHQCIDWSATPPARKAPFLILTRGDEHVYTAVPKELKTLEDVARKEFGLGDTAGVRLSSSCANLCSGRLARITEAAWEHMRTLIGCVTVEVAGDVMDVDGLPPRGSAKRKLPADEEEADTGDTSDHGPGSQANHSATEAVQAIPSDHVNESDPGNASAPEDEQKAPFEEEVSVPPRKVRRRRRLVPEDEDEDEGQESEREPTPPAEDQVPSDVPSPELSQPSTEVRKENVPYSLSQPDAEPAEHPQGLNKSVKQEKGASGTDTAGRPNSHNGSLHHPHTESYPEFGTQTQPESSDNPKLMIRVAHRPSKQESKFTTKSTTKVGKVLTGVCKSFGLEVNLATLYLIVSTEDEHGEEENLFPCDVNDTIARAGAERDMESRFLLKMAGEA